MNFFSLHTFVLIIHIVVCIELIIVVLLQVGKGNSLGGIFGGSSQTVFGTQGETVLSKITTFSAIAFMVTSIVLSLTPTGNSVIKKSPAMNFQTQNQAQPQQTQAPAQVQQQPMSQQVEEGQKPQSPAQPAASQNQTVTQQTTVNQSASQEKQAVPSAVINKQQVQTQAPQNVQSGQASQGNVK
ncbi:preprotein translocase subunit SecG [Candidatus Dependentiae bacterium]|nr:preprotein translocase subunit SecG [Candidatus Dependentiae bacterium]